MVTVARRSSTLPLLHRLSRRSPVVRTEPRRIARPDAQDASRELLLANDLSHAPVEHKFDALLARAEFEAPGKGGAVPNRARCGDFAGVCHDAWREVARTLAVNSCILLRDGSGLDVRLVAEHQEGNSPSRA